MMSVKASGSRNTWISNPKAILKDESGQASRTAATAGDNMAQNHYTTKAKRRPKNGNRKNSAPATMAKLRELAAADAKKSAK
jgi:hypothetical protein